jgi:Icc protein
MKVSRFLALSIILLVILLGVSSIYSAPFSFIAMADSRGSTNGVNDAVLSDIVNLILQEDAVFVFFPGDLVSGSCTESILTSQIDHWRDIMAPLYSSNMYGAKVYAGPGNHDICNSGSELVWQSIFSDLPSDGPSGETNMTYSFDYMNAHFIMLDTDRAGKFHTINYDWLADDLAATTMEHIFVFGHDPAFPAGPHLGSSLDYYPDQRDAFWQLLVDYDVDIYFAGHEHLYNHINVDGVDQIIAGTSGAPIYHGYGGEFYHYAVVTVDGPAVFVEIIDDSGVLRDSFDLFCLNDPVRIERTGLTYPTLQDAYDDAEHGDIVQSQNKVFIEQLNINQNKAVNIEGGYNCDYSAITGETVQVGTMTISDGILTIANFSLEQ